MRSFRGIFALVLCIGLTGGSHSRADEVDDLVRKQLSSQSIPGLALAVVKDGKVVKSAGYGLADIETKAPVSPDTVFQIQSITKQFTAAGIMLLVEGGKVHLDDPVSQYLDGTPAAWSKITLRHLLTQTSGLKDFINDALPNTRPDASEEELTRAIENRALNFAPGDVWEYSNTNYFLLALVIRRATGEWYGDFLGQRIFKPLGMTRTAVMRVGEVVNNQANGYVIENGRRRDGYPIPPSMVGYGGGGIRSTVLDLAKWDAALDTETILKRSSIQQMVSPVKLNNGTMHNYGFGWEITSIGGHRLIWHAGRFTSGFCGQIDRFADDHLSVIVLTNLYNAPAGDIARRVAGIYLPAVAPPVYKPIEDREPTITRRFRDLLQRTADGNLTADDFTPLAWTYIAPLQAQLKKDFSSFGAIRKMSLVERSEQDGDRSYRYRTEFEKTTFILHFVISKDDRVSMMMPEEVNQ